MIELLPRPRTIARAALPLVALLLACGPADADGPADETGNVAEAAPVSPRENGPGPGSTPGSAEAERPRPGTAWVIFGADTVVAEVARTADERARGLMYRDEVPDGTGMLFVFDRAEIQSFWMQNTYVPLDIAFMDAGFRVVDIQQMEPESTDQHESAGPALFALEVRQGWFGEHGVEVGDVAEIVFGG